MSVQSWEDDDRAAWIEAQDDARPTYDEELIESQVPVAMLGGGVMGMSLRFDDSDGLIHVFGPRKYTINREGAQQLREFLDRVDGLGFPPEPSRPVIETSSVAAGNIYALITTVARALKAANQHDRVLEWHDRAKAIDSYAGTLEAARDFVDLR